MKKKILLICVLSLYISSVYAQVLLDADGNNNTYELITSVLAPNYNPVEVPDCNHSSFGRHIDEPFDNDLGINVFRFYIHTTPDNDRCINTDRQRNEIKSYNKSPDNLLGIEGETVEYKWKFKLESDFQVSPNFTHLHQLKSVGGSLESMPMYTLTARKSNPDRLELRYAETNSQITLLQKDLSTFKGTWLEVTETITYGSLGKYSITITKVSDSSILLNYSNDNIINWRENAEFVRPKWGIYRSLINVQNLKDEQVLFANFSITELESLSIKDITEIAKIVPNPSKNSIRFIENKTNSFDNVDIYDVSGKIISKNVKLQNNTLNISHLTKGIYLLLLKHKNTIAARHKLVIK